MKVLKAFAYALLAAVTLFLFIQQRNSKQDIEQIKKQLSELTAKQVQPVVNEPDNPFTNPPVDQIHQTTNDLPRYGNTSISFTKTSHDFGKVNAGEKVTTKFHFKNTGNNPLVISNAVGSCGCTVPNYPQHPIAPGEEADIDVRYDSSGKRGEEIKTVTITANTEPPTRVLTIKATVIPPAM